MSRFSKIVSLILVVLWLPVTMHCQIERLGLHELFACHEQSSDHPDQNACETDSCQLLEAGQFAIAKSKSAPSIRITLLRSIVHHLPRIALVIPAPSHVLTRQDETLPLRRTWQFTRRAALPARAPSVSST